MGDLTQFFGFRTGQVRVFFLYVSCRYKSLLMTFIKVQTRRKIFNDLIGYYNTTCLESRTYINIILKTAKEGSCTIGDQHPPIPILLSCIPTLFLLPFFYECFWYKY